jgi:F-type H+-transporting ATPase subunit epsilon
MSDGKILELEVISPQKLVYSDKQVSYVSAPSTSGVIGILPGHTSLISSLAQGDLKCLEKEGSEIHIRIDSGFIQVRNNKVLVLAEEARLRDEP